MFAEWVCDVCIICDFTFFVNANALRHTFLYWYFMGLTCIEPVASVDVFSLSLSLRQTMANVNVEHRQANISHVPNPAIRIPRTSVSIAYARFVVQRYTHILTLSQSQCRMLKASKYFDITYENSIWLPSGIRFVFIGEERARHDTDISLNNTIIQIHALITGSKVLFTKTT